MMCRKLMLLFTGLTISVELINGQEDTTAHAPGGFSKYRFGSYGEIRYQHLNFGPDRYTLPDGAPADNRSLIGIPRMVLGFDYKFTQGIIFSTEIEFEHGGTGSALELEYEEMGEYEMEMEKAGEVVLEQFHLVKVFSEAFKVRIGHMIVPVGETNARHLPVEFFGTVRPEGESSLIHLTWHETGIAILGGFKDWKYEFQLVNGLDANGFSSANWIKSGKQGIFEDIRMTQPAITGRVENISISSLRLGVSGYYGKSAKNTTKPEKLEGLDGAVSIYSADAEFNNKRLIVRGNAIYGDLSDSYGISSVNKNISKNIQYPRTPVAKNALCWAFETGFNVLSFFHTSEKLFPFVRYEYYNSMQKTAEGILADKRFHRNVFTLGVNYYLLPDLALKMDYAARVINGGSYNNENTFGMALVYSTWFIRK